MSACQAAFDTNELFEAILLEVPVKTLLLAQRTDRHWHDMISGTKKLQQKLFMLPVKTSAAAFAAGCHITELRNPASVFTPHSSTQHARGIRLLNPLIFNMANTGRRQMVMTLRPDKLVTSPGKIYRKRSRSNAKHTRRVVYSSKDFLELRLAVTDITPSIHGIVPSWSRMLPLQPPLDQIRHLVYIDSARELSKGILHGTHSLGDIVNELLEVVRDTGHGVSIDLKGCSRTMRTLKR